MISSDISRLLRVRGYLLYVNLSSTAMTRNIAVELSTITYHRVGAPESKRNPVGQ
jgi:hypothetical protein